MTPPASHFLSGDWISLSSPDTDLVCHPSFSASLVAGIPPQAQGLTLVGDSGDGVPVEEATEEWVGAASHLCRGHEARRQQPRGPQRPTTPIVRILASQPPLSLTPWKPGAHLASLTLTKRLRMARPLGPLEAALRFP